MATETNRTKTSLTNLTSPALNTAWDSSSLAMLGAASYTSPRPRYLLPDHLFRKEPKFRRSNILGSLRVKSFSIIFTLFSLTLSFKFVNNFLTLCKLSLPELCLKIYQNNSQYHETSLIPVSFAHYLT